jgi:hypothetical protein
VEEEEEEPDTSRLGPGSQPAVVEEEEEGIGSSRLGVVASSRGNAPRE